MVTTERLTRKQVQKARALFWGLWTAGVSMPINLIAYFVIGSWWTTPVIMTVATVIGFNYCEWLIKRRQWRAVNTRVLCECGHEDSTHQDQRNCLHAGLGGHGGTLRRDCICLRYTPRFWRMSERT